MNRYMGRFGATPPTAMAPAPSGASLPLGAPGVPAGAMSTDQFGHTASQKNRFWFTYQTPNIASIAAAASTTNTILFDNDSVFEWTKITAVADLAGAAQTNSTIVIPLVTVQIQDTGQGAYYSNAPVPLLSYAGSWGLPYVLPAPQFIAPNATLQFTWNNYSAGTTYLNLRLQLHGFKIKRS